MFTIDLIILSHTVCAEFDYYFLFENQYCGLIRFTAPGLKFKRTRTSARVFELLYNKTRVLLPCSIIKCSVLVPTVASHKQTIKDMIISY